jgi:hypothetical protein
MHANRAVRGRRLFDACGIEKAQPQSSDVNAALLQYLSALRFVELNAYA